MNLLEKLKKLNGERTQGSWRYDMSSGFPRVTVPCYKGPRGTDAFEVDTCDGRSCKTAEFIAEFANSADALIELVEVAKAFIAVETLEPWDETAEVPYQRLKQALQPFIEEPK